MESVFREALAHQKAGRLDQAEALYRGIVDWRPTWVLGNLGALYRSTGRLAEAEAVFREALAHDPDNVELRHSLGMTLIQRGCYAEGWANYEARHARRKRPVAPFPEWRGESLAGKHILVLAEQGFGDQILWSRFVPLLVGMAADVTVMAPRVLLRLFEGLGVRVIYPESWDAVSVDVWASFGSVPRWLEAGPADARLPTLRLGDRAQPPGGVGLMLDGGATNPNPARLPVGPVARAFRGLGEFVDLAPAASGAGDFADTAAIIAGLDGVVTVDTAVAHLAGSMGKPCWVLAPRPAVDWYLNWEDDRSPWYPSLRTLRQRTPGDWAGVLADLAAVLQQPGLLNES